MQKYTPGFPRHDMIPLKWTPEKYAAKTLCVTFLRLRAIL